MLLSLFITEIAQMLFYMNIILANNWKIIKMAVGILVELGIIKWTNKTTLNVVNLVCTHIVKT